MDEVCRGRRRARAGAASLLLALLLVLAPLLHARAQMPDTDVPFVVTPDSVTLAMLELAGVGPDDHVIDLGSGDGRIVILAAKRYGASGLGVEIVDELVQLSRRHAERAGVAARTQFRTEDLFTTDLSPASVITMYLLPEVNLQLRPKLLALRPGTRIVSHDYDLGDWRPDRSIVVDAPDKPVGKDKISRLHLWVVPASLAGQWCGDSAAGGATLQVEQHHQQLDVRSGPQSSRLVGRVHGSRARLEAADGSRLELEAAGDQLTVVEASGTLAAQRDGRYRRPRGTRCG